MARENIGERLVALMAQGVSSGQDMVTITLQEV